MTTNSVISLARGNQREEAQTSAATAIASRHLGCCKQIGILAVKEFSDRFRSGWVITCAFVWLGAIALTSLFGLVQMGRIGVLGYERTVMSLLNLVQYLVPLLGLLLGHDLIVGEREERTLPLLLAGGVSRARLLSGKFVGGVMTLALPLILGFVIAGTAIGVAAKDNSFGSFLRLAVSGLGLGIVFLAIGLMLSTLCRTRVRALVAALLMWCLAVFVFDLVALGVLISTRAPGAAQEIDLVCDATHQNAAVDLHAAFDEPAVSSGRIEKRAKPTAFSWLLLNPVDLFRAVNLSTQTGLLVPTWIVALTVGCWLSAALGISARKLSRMDL